MSKAYEFPPDHRAMTFDVNKRAFPITIHDLALGYGLEMAPEVLSAHLRLILLAWANTSDPVGCLEDNDERLARMAHVHIVTFRRIKAHALHGFRLHDGLWIHDELVAAFDRGTKAVTTQAELRRGSRNIPARVRFFVLARDGFKCVYCGRSADIVSLEIDHIIPLVSGGSNEVENLQTACFDCNAGKTGRLITVPVIKVVE